MKNASLGIGLIGLNKQEAFLRGLRSLQYIELSNNNFTEPFINEMLSDQFDSLLSLVIDNNLFNHIPVILSNFQKLHQMDLRNNKIHILTQVEIEDIENLNKKNAFEEVTFISGRKYQFYVIVILFILLNGYFQQLYSLIVKGIIPVYIPMEAIKLLVKSLNK
jgi:hypothetical protein